MQHQQGLQALQPTPPSAPQMPRIGDDILYVLPDGRSTGQIRPAKAVRVWGTAVNLVAILDGYNDYPPEHIASLTCKLWKPSVAYSAAMEPGTWHWPSDELAERSVTSTIHQML